MSNLPQPIALLEVAMAIRRRSEPLRYQIRNDILDLLIQDNYQPGDKLPTESELTELLSVSRSTLREGLHLLEEERVIRTKHGTGRFVIAPLKDYKFDVTRLQSVTEMLADYGMEVTTRVFSVTEKPADSQLAACLELEIGTLVICIERARYADNVPVIYSIDIIPKSILHDHCDPKLFEGSLFILLEESCGIRPDYTRTTIRSVVSKAMVPTSVVSSPSVPWILLEQVNFTKEGQAVIYSRDFHHGEYVTFHLTRYRH